MKKAKITSPKEMAQSQINEDISMTPLERIELAFQISDFALEIQRTQEGAKEEPSTIQWIELRKISSQDDEGDAR